MELEKVNVHVVGMDVPPEGVSRNLGAEQLQTSLLEQRLHHPVELGGVYRETHVPVLFPPLISTHGVEARAQLLPQLASRTQGVWQRGHLEAVDSQDQRPLLEVRGGLLQGKAQHTPNFDAHRHARTGGYLSRQCRGRRELHPECDQILVLLGWHVLSAHVQGPDLDICLEVRQVVVDTDHDGLHDLAHRFHQLQSEGRIHPCSHGGSAICFEKVHRLCQVMANPGRLLRSRGPRGIEPFAGPMAAILLAAFHKQVAELSQWQALGHCLYGPSPEGA
mmetsp:Transcript_33404/g.75723  ORF Transcript_33404/g.75723 Transcript_33404/m.75723 type:complete len:277 (+) Transcript_33404:634-1464(+)